VRSDEQDLEFERIEIPGEFDQVAFQLLLVLHLFRLGFRLAQLHHHAKIFELFFGGDDWIDFLSQAASLVDQLLGQLAIIPEVVLRHQIVEFRQPFLQGGDVKETSADGRVSLRRVATEL